MLREWEVLVGLRNPIPVGHQVILGCIPVNISEEPALMLNSLTLAKLFLCPISTEKFSSWPKLLGTTIKVLHVCERFRNKIIPISDPKTRSLVYLLKIMQQSFFTEELIYLLLEGATRARRTPPSLAHNLNLFMDAEWSMQSAGRVHNNLLLSYNAKNPIWLIKSAILLLS